MAQCPLCRRMFETKAELRQHRLTCNAVPGKKKKEKTTTVTNQASGVQSYAASFTGNDSTTVLKAEELAYVLDNQVDSNSLNSTNRLNFWPGASGLTRLDQVGRMFEQYRVLSLKVSYKTSSGTVTSGSSITAFDYEASDFPIELGALQVRQPRIRVPVWQNAEFKLDPSRVNKSSWMFTAAGVASQTPGFTSAGYIVSSAPGAEAMTAYGEVWIEYEVLFTGPSTSNSNVVYTSGSYSGIWNGTSASAVSDAFEITGAGTDTLNITPRFPGEYYVGLDAIAAATPNWQTLIDSVTNAIVAGGGTYKVITSIVASSGRSFWQAIIDLRNTIPNQINLPVSLLTSGYAINLARSSGGTARVA